MALRDLGNILRTSGQSVSSSARNMTEIAKRNSQIQEATKTINALYLEIGKQYFNIHAAESDAEFSDLMGRVLIEQDKIDRLNEEIKQIKGIVRCPVCGGENNSGSQFCSQCGQQLFQRTQRNQNVNGVVPLFCTGCGNKLQPGMAFCTECGRPVNKPEEAVHVDNQQDTGNNSGNVNICPKCGKQLSPGMDFCTECGTPVTSTDVCEEKQGEAAEQIHMKQEEIEETSADVQEISEQLDSDITSDDSVMALDEEEVQLEEIDEKQQSSQIESKETIDTEEYAEHIESTDEEEKSEEAYLPGSWWLCSAQRLFSPYPP